MPLAPLESISEKDEYQTKRAILLLLVCLFPLGACALLNRETELKGEILIVTNGAQSKLASVEVSAIPEKDMAAYVRTSAEHFEGQRVELRRAVDAAEKDLADATQELEIRQKEFDESGIKPASAQPAAKSTVPGGSSGEARTAVKDPESPAARAEARLKQQSAIVTAKKNRLEAARTSVENWPTAASVFAELPKTAIKATTDADGKFALKLTAKEKYAVAAKFHRTSASGTEDYYWLVWVDTNSASQPVVLSNNNLMTSSDSPENIIKVTAMTK